MCQSFTNRILNHILSVFLVNTVDGSGKRFEPVQTPKVHRYGRHCKTFFYKKYLTYCMNLNQTSVINTLMIRKIKSLISLGTISYCSHDRSNIQSFYNFYFTHFRPHIACTQRCDPLLHMSHTRSVVCVSVCCAMGTQVSSIEMPVWQLTHVGPRNHYQMGSRSDESIRSREG